MTKHFIPSAADGVRLLAEDRPWLAQDHGIILDPMTAGYLPDQFRTRNGFNHDAVRRMAFDAQPALTTAANSAVLALMTTLVDPDVLRILFSPLKMAKIYAPGEAGERKKGGWTDYVYAFPVVEFTGETTTYGDYSEAGSAGANMNWPQRQSYHFQTIVQYGEREVEMAAKANVNLASEKQRAAIWAINQFRNKTYAFGVKGLQNYGLLNDPNLSAALQPGPKAYGSQAHGPWITNGVPTATPNEIFIDVQTMYISLVQQSAGVIELNRESPMVLALPPDVEVALTSANSFNVMVTDLLKKAFPNIRLEAAVQYDSTVNGFSGNMAQLICTDVMGQETGYMAFTEKLRTHPMIVMMSAWMQKLSGGTWGSILRQPFAVVSMIGL